MGRTAPGSGLLTALLLALLASAGARAVPSYFKAEGTLVLRPARLPEQINGIVWKHEKHLLAEWMEAQINLTYYSRFEGRSHLNTTTAGNPQHDHNRHWSVFSGDQPQGPESG